MLNLDFDFSGVSIGMECNGGWREGGNKEGVGMVSIDINETFTREGGAMKMVMVHTHKHETNNI